MTRVVLVRHGKAQAGFDEDLDPGLDDTGHEQAEAVCAALAQREPMSLLTSPMIRARETAQPLESRWGIALVEPALGEIPSPHDDLGERTLWLRAALRGTWRDVDDVTREWRNRVIETLVATPGDSVVFTHFVAINVAVGAATADERVMVFAPDYCSVTELDVVDGRLALVSRGDEATTVVR